MRESRSWQAARAMPKGKERNEAFKDLRRRFGFSFYDLKPFTASCRNNCWIGDHLGSQEVQALTNRAIKTVEQYAYGKRGRPRFKRFGEFNSVENQTNASGLRFLGDRIEWRPKQGGKQLAIHIHTPDDYQGEALNGRVKHCRVIRREIRGSWRWYAQVMLEGSPPQRRAHGSGVVGIDLGPSTIAMVSDGDAALEQFCPTVEQPWRELRTIERAMDRSKRATNPDAFNPNGTWKRGARATVRSRRYQRLALKRRERERRLAAERKRAHGELANRVLGQGADVRLEKLSYRAFQKCFGRSTKVRGAGTFVLILKNKIAAANGQLIEINPFKTALSQFDHTTGEYVKKPLSQRAHHFGDGITPPVQRDLYSAFLARHCVGPETLDVHARVPRMCGDEPPWCLISKLTLG
jgi:putative transposase